MSTPTRLGSKIAVSANVEKTVRERLATLEKDKKTARPWREVKARILKQANPN